MKKIELRTQMKEETLAVPVEFIDTFMPSASGEAVKVYLCLLRAAQDPSAGVAPEEMADLFDLTPKKLMQILAYWEEKGLLRIERYDGEISGLEILKFGGSSVREAAAAPVIEDEQAEYRPSRREAAPEDHFGEHITIADTAAFEPVPERPLNIHDLDEDDAFTELLGLTEFYLKKPLMPTQRESLGTCYLLFDRQADVIEYLLEYCIDQGHQSFHYIESVARGWKKEGLNSLAEIREAAASRNKNIFSIKKAFGIANRALVRDESAFAEAWTKKFDLELVLEACSRTMSAIHTPSFQYADSILKSWEEKGVRSLSDVEAVDRERKAKAQKPEESRNPARVRNAFQNFEQRKTDYSALIPNYYEG